ncbi:MAG: hypothetical protein EXQ86_02515 [Rhodospirillales bacterium]|nr:hypothetical protein [Rhodospirillales bacterium]
MCGARLANGVLASGVVLSGLMLAFVLWKRDSLLGGGMRTAFFVGFPALGIVACLAAFRLSPANRLAFALTAAAAAIAIYAAEAWLTFGRYVGGEPVPAGARDFDTRTKYQVVEDQRRQGIGAYPAVFPAYLLRTEIGGTLRSPLSLDGAEVLPLGGVARAPTVLCNESGRYVSYESDEMGFNNPRGLTADRAPLAVAALGDSFAQGYCVPPDKNFVALIRATVPATLNLGTSGAGPLISLAALKEFLPARRPATVLWFFFEGNDVPGDLSIERKSPLLLRYLNSSQTQDLDRRAGPVDAVLRAHVDALIATSAGRRETDAGPLQTAISMIGLAKVRDAIGLPSTADIPDYPLFRQILGEAKRTVDGWGGRLVVIYLPSFGSVTGTRHPTIDAVYANVPGITRELGLPLIDMRETFTRHLDPASLFPFRSRGHYNEAGHALVAKTVLEFLPRS